MKDTQEPFDPLRPSEEPGEIPSEDYIRSLPKVELHCHLDGSLRLETIWELAQSRKRSSSRRDRWRSCARSSARRMSSATWWIT